MIELAIGIALLASVFDALRDAWIKEGWWKRHIVKWLSFYPPLIFIIAVHVPWIYWAPVAVAAWVVWRLSVKHIGGKNWESHWFRHIKE